MPFIIYRNQEIPQIREKRMTFYFRKVSWHLSSYNPKRNYLTSKCDKSTNPLVLTQIFISL